MDINRTLKKIIHSPSTHARWLNSLSYLEYRGFRKIARSQPTERMSFELLMHTAEEIRHSLFFKKQAIHLGGDSFKFYHEETLLCSSALKNYFFELDKSVVGIIDGQVGEPIYEAAYYFITWLIEMRAMSIYQVYNQLLHQNQFDFSLTGILREENLHLQEMVNRSKTILTKNRISPQPFQHAEDRHFANMWTEIENRIFSEAALMEISM